MVLLSPLSPGVLSPVSFVIRLSWTGPFTSIAGFPDSFVSILSWAETYASASVFPLSFLESFSILELIVLDYYLLVTLEFTTFEFYLLTTYDYFSFSEAFNDFLLSFNVLSAESPGLSSFLLEFNTDCS